MIYIQRLFIGLMSILLPIMTFSQGINVTHPIAGSVIQRNTNNGANVAFTGSIGYGFDNTSNYNHSIKIERLDLQIGAILNGVTPITQNISLTNVIGSNISTFKTNIYITAGWYQATVLVTPKAGGSSLGGTSQRKFKFGVGDIYIVAGQSNAQGFQPGFDTGLINFYSNTDPNQYFDDSTIPDAMRVIGQVETNFVEHLNETITFNQFDATDVEQNLIKKSLPIRKGFERLTLQKPLSAPSLQYGTGANQVRLVDRPIYPSGVASWVWAPFGKKYIDIHGVPVALYNVAVSDTDITSWQKGSSNQNNLYSRLLNTLQVQANITGFRAILWHQGEADAILGTSDYQTKLQTLVNTIQQDFDPSRAISWYISLVSHYGKDPNNNNNLTDPNIISAQSTAGFSTSIKRIGISSDIIGWQQRGQGAKIHLSGPSLNTAASLWENQLNTNLAAPVLPTGLVPSLSYGTMPIGIQIELTVNNSSNYSEIKWVKNEQGIDNAISTGPSQLVSAFSGTKDYYTAYVKPNGKNYYEIMAPYITANSSDSYAALIINREFLTIDRTRDFIQQLKCEVYSNNMAWTANVASGGNWLSINQNPSGNSGTEDICFQLNQNNSPSMRTGTVTFTGTAPNASTITRTLTINQFGANNLPITSLSPTCNSTGWGTNYFDGRNCIGNPITVHGVSYSQGIGTHAGGNICYTIPSGYSYFKGKVGRDDGADNCGCGTMQSRFSIKVNGSTVWTSGLHGVNTPPEDFSVALNGATSIELVSEIGDSNNWGDWSNWIKPVLSNTAGSGGSGTVSPPNPIIANPNTINSGQSSTLTATCPSGTVQWQHGASGNSTSVSPSTTTTYSARCIVGANTSSYTPVTVTVNGSSSCAPANNTVMGSWNVTGHQLITRDFHGQKWLVQKLNINGSQYDEFIVRASQMLARGDVSLNDGSYSGLVSCYAWQYSGYGGLVPPNENSNPAFPIPAGFQKLTTSDGSVYYSDFQTSTSGLANGQCYKVRSIANNNYATDMGNGTIHFIGNNNQNSQVWKLEGSGTQFKIKRAQQNERMLYQGHATGIGVNSTGTQWQFDDNNGAYRISNPSNSETWDHSGSGTQPTLIIYGTTSNGFHTHRLFAFDNVSCPNGARVGEKGNAIALPENELPFLAVAPNPATEVFYAVINLEEASEINTSLLTSTGISVMQKTIAGHKGVNQLHYETKGLVPGVYLLQVNTRLKSETKKVIVK